MANVNARIEGTNLVITVDISPKARAAATVSKSALEKALAKGLPEPKPTLIASTGGFTTVGDIKLSLNAMLG